MPSQVLSFGGRIFEITRNFINALQDAGGDDETAKPLWASRGLANDVAEVLMGRKKFVRSTPLEIALGAVLQSDRFAAVLSLNPNEPKEHDQLTIIAEGTGFDSTVRYQAIGRLSPNCYTRVTVANNTQDAGLINQAMSTITTARWLYEIASVAESRHAKEEAIRKMGILGHNANLRDFYLATQDGELAFLAVWNMTDVAMLEVFQNDRKFGPTVRERIKVLKTAAN